MTIEQCYEKLGGDFRRVCSRLPGRSFVERFMKRYLEDDSAQQMLLALEKRDTGEAYRYALALKGVAGNLGFENLERAAAELAKTLRDCGGVVSPDILTLAEKVRRNHTAAVKILRLYLEEGQ